jgi:hypothetical protein
VLLDMSAAFCTMDHKILLYMAAHATQRICVGVRRCKLAMIRAFLIGSADDSTLKLLFHRHFFNFIGRSITEISPLPASFPAVRRPSAVTIAEIESWFVHIPTVGVERLPFYADNKYADPLFLSSVGDAVEIQKRMSASSQQ